ncbi:hypothetical protein [Pseudomonas moraviensis]
MNSQEFESVRQAALRALAPIRFINSNTKADKHFLLNGKKAEAGRQLPPYYLVYFLLVDLLGFKNLGRFEKIDWSVPIDFNGQAYIVEHGKFGLNLFAHDPEKEKTAIDEIVARINKAVKSARPYFDFLAFQAVEQSKINVKNNSIPLRDRYDFLKNQYDMKLIEIKLLDEAYAFNLKQRQLPFGMYLGFPSSCKKDEANWLAISAIEAFFSWTEHVMIHVAVLIGAVNSAREVADLAADDWPKKFKSIFNLKISVEKNLFDRALSLRQDLRNFIAHGAFGKRGEAFTFHSTAGAVPVLLPHKRGSDKFSLSEQLDFDTVAAFEVIESFTSLLWAGDRAPARLYVQESRLPTIMTFVSNGSYRAAMVSLESMRQLIDELTDQIDRATNMDW